jgi:hypothetical protein
VITMREHEVCATVALCYTDIDPPVKY